MPRHPDFANAVMQMTGSVYSRLAHKLATHPGEVYPLHVGDTWMAPAVGCRAEDFTEATHPGMHRYSAPQGRPELMDAIIARTERTQGRGAERSEILVTAGATGGLGAVIGAIANPGDEVLVLAPFWPLIAGIARSFGVKPVPVPFFGVAEDAASAVKLVDKLTTSRTVALYLNTPSNPTGQVIPRPWLEALVAFARQRDLWILADEVYEHYAWGAEHTYTRPLAPERTFSTHSFSKAYGMAGNRCGYLIGPTAAMDAARKIGTHSFYAAPTVSQLCATAALTGPGDAWAAHAARSYQSVGQAAAKRLGLAAPLGSTFLFFDVASALDERGLAGFLEDLVDQGVFLAPGESFGPYPTHVRLCYTAAPPDVVLRGVDVVARRMNR